METSLEIWDHWRSCSLQYGKHGILLPPERLMPPNGSVWVQEGVRNDAFNLILGEGCIQQECNGMHPPHKVRLLDCTTTPGCTSRTSKHYSDQGQSRITRKLDSCWIL